MTNIQKNGNDDQALNEGLDKIGHEYGQLPADEPPRLLDQAILNSAHRAVEQKPHWMKFGWVHGLTTAAVMVLALSLILNRDDSTPVFEDGLKTSESARLQSDIAVPEKINHSNRELRKKMVSEHDLNESLSEENMNDPTDTIIDTQESDQIYRQAAPMAAAGLSSSEKQVQQNASPETQIEQDLLAIIRLKQSGDAAWKSALERFKRTYPDYPLPAELKVP